MRLFVAVWPPDDLVSAIALLPRPEAPGVRWTTSDQWHVTLRFLGRMDAGVGPAGAGGEGGGAELLARRLAGADLRPCSAVAGPASECLGDSVLSLPVDGLDALASAVVAATTDVGEPPDTRPFRGHLTLARARRRAPRGALRRLAGAEISASWHVHEIGVVSSTLTAAGARYETLATVPFGTPGPSLPRRRPGGKVNS
jgi:2'-5' RNA ligase